MEEALRVHNVHKTYEGGKVALAGVSLSVKKGDFFALLGPNGAGKSTLIGVVCSLIKKTKGDIVVLGKNIDTNVDEAKMQIGLVPQEVNADIFTTVEDVLYIQAGYYGISRREARPQVDMLIERMKLGDKRKSQTIELSGGMKRRLIIARALVHKPRLLFLDEPTAGVDVELRHDMWNFLRDLNESGVTIVLTTHYLEEAEKLCKHLALIDNGVIKASGTMDEICNGRKLEDVYLELTKAAGHDSTPTV